MIELNGWFFILLLNFLILIYILNTLLFKPLISLFKERENIVEESLQAARALNEKKEEALSSMNSEMSKAKLKASIAYEQLRDEGLAIQKEYLDAAYKEAAEKIEKARKEISEETVKAREFLESEAKNYSQQIINKLMN